MIYMKCIYRMIYTFTYLYIYMWLNKVDKHFSDCKIIDNISVTQSNKYECIRIGVYKITFLYILSYINT